MSQALIDYNDFSNATPPLCFSKVPSVRGRHLRYIHTWIFFQKLWNYRPWGNFEETFCQLESGDDKLQVLQFGFHKKNSEKYFFEKSTNRFWTTLECLAQCAASQTPALPCTINQPDTDNRLFHYGNCNIWHSSRDNNLANSHIIKVRRVKSDTFCNPFIREVLQK